MIRGIGPVHSVTYDGVILSVYHANKEHGIPRHEHAYSHLVVCHAGSCLITKENKSLTMTKNTQPVNLVAAEWHEIESLEDGTVFVTMFSENQN
jgi:hypothetical protein